MCFVFITYGRISASPSALYMSHSHQILYPHTTSICSYLLPFYIYVYVYFILSILNLFLDSFVFIHFIFILSRVYGLLRVGCSLFAFFSVSFSRPPCVCACVCVFVHVYMLLCWGREFLLTVYPFPVSLSVCLFGCIRRGIVDRISLSLRLSLPLSLSLCLRVL